MSTQVITPLIQIRKINDPFNVCARWPQEDESVERIEIGDCIAQLPHGDHRVGLEDGLVEFMQECWRVLIPGGTLGIIGPIANHGLALAHPRNCRFLCRETFFPFGRPAVHIHGDQSYYDRWTWGLFDGEDFGVRFEIAELAESSGSIEVEMEKPADGDP